MFGSSPHSCRCWAAAEWELGAGWGQILFRRRPHLNINAQWPHTQVSTVNSTAGAAIEFSVWAVISFGASRPLNSECANLYKKVNNM